MSAIEQFWYLENVPALFTFNAYRVARLGVSFSLERA